MERTEGGAGVWNFARNGSQDVALFDSARPQPPAADPEVEAGRLDRDIDQILEEDKARPAKQRHSAKRIFERPRAEYAFPGGYTMVKDYVRERKLRQREMFVPLAHPPGHAQADFGEALVVIAGQERKAHYFCLDPPHSDDCFVMAFPAETTEAFLEGHVQAPILAECRKRFSPILFPGTKSGRNFRNTPPK